MDTSIDIDRRINISPLVAHRLQTSSLRQQQLSNVRSKQGSHELLGQQRNSWILRIRHPVGRLRIDGLSPAGGAVRFHAHTYRRAYHVRQHTTLEERQQCCSKETANWCTASSQTKRRKLVQTPRNRLSTNTGLVSVPTTDFKTRLATGNCTHNRWCTVRVRKPLAGHLVYFGSRKIQLKIKITQVFIS